MFIASVLGRSSVEGVVKDCKNLTISSAFPLGGEMIHIECLLSGWYSKSYVGQVWLASAWPEISRQIIISASRMLRWNFWARREFVTGCWKIYGWNLRSDMVQKLNTCVPVNG